MHSKIINTFTKVVLIQPRDSNNTATIVISIHYTVNNQWSYISSINRAGVCKKQEFCHTGGKLIHILTFWGRLIQFSPLTRVKIEILLYKYSIFKHILNSSEYFVCFYLLFYTFYL